MVSRPLKSISISVFTAFLSNTILQPLAEASVWEERRSHQTQLASLPLANQTFPTFLNQLPAVSKPVLDFTPKINLQLSSSSLRDLVGAIPLSHALIQELYDSKDSKNPPLVLVQDVHMNAEAQNNISVTLQGLLDKGKIEMVGVEGAFDRFDFAPFRVYADKEKTRWVVQAYMEKNELAAPSFVGITSPSEPPLFMGIDDRDHYDANVKAYRDASDRKKKVLSDLEQLKRALADEKKRVFGADLFRFDGWRSAYHQGGMDIGPYVEKLGAGDDLTLAAFLEAYGMEKTLDFNRVEHERQMILERLSSKLSERELQDLLAQSLAYKMGRLGFGAYYDGLRTLCEERGVSLKKAPAFNTYIQYVLLADGIRADQLFDATEKRENDVLHGLVKNGTERDLIVRDNRAMLSEKLIDFSLTAKEWEKYKTVRSAQSGLEPFEQFYEEADMRSKKMLANLVKHGKGRKAAVIGGFHTRLLTDHLRNQKISYVVVSPKLSKVDAAAGSSYLSVFDREKNPLQKLLAGEKLFLAPEFANVTFPAKRAQIDGSVKVRQGVPSDVRIVNPNDPTQDRPAGGPASFFNDSEHTRKPWATLPVTKEEFSRVVPKEIQLLFEAAKKMGVKILIVGGSARDVAVSVQADKPMRLPYTKDFDLAFVGEVNQPEFERIFRNLLASFYETSAGGSMDFSTARMAADRKHLDVQFGRLLSTGEYVYEFLMAEREKGTAFSISKFAVERKTDGSFVIFGREDALRNLREGVIEIWGGDELPKLVLTMKMLGKWAIYAEYGFDLLNPASGKARDVLVRAVREHVRRGMVPNMLNIILAGVTKAAHTGSASEAKARTDRVVESFNLSEIGGVIQSIKLPALWLIRKVSPNFSNGAYNRFIAPNIENVLVLLAQYGLMQSGMDAWMAGLWVWGGFAVIHIIEWAVFPKHYRPPFMNVVFALIISASGVGLLALFPFDGFRSLSAGLYALNVTGLHGFANYVGNLFFSESIREIKKDKKIEPVEKSVPEPIAETKIAPLLSEVEIAATMASMVARTEAELKNIAENPDNREQVMQWTRETLAKLNAPDFSGRTEELIPLLVSFFSGRVSLVAFDQYRYFWEDTGAEKSGNILSIEQKTNGIIRENNLAHWEFVSRFYEAWTRRFKFEDTFNNEQLRHAAIKFFQEKVTARTDLRLVGSDPAKPEQIVVAAFLLSRLPEKFLKSAVVQHALRGGIAVGFKSAEDSNRVVHYDAQHGIMAMHSTVFSLRRFIEIFVSEIGSAIMASSAKRNPTLDALFLNIYRQQASPSFSREKYSDAAGYFEAAGRRQLFVESFLFYFLYGRRMAQGFRDDVGTQKSLLWKSIHEFLGHWIDSAEAPHAFERPRINNGQKQLTQFKNVLWIRAGGYRYRIEPIDDKKFVLERYSGDVRMADDIRFLDMNRLYSVGRVQGDFIFSNDERLSSRHFAFNVKPIANGHYEITVGDRSTNGTILVTDVAPSGGIIHSLKSLVLKLFPKLSSQTYDRAVAPFLENGLVFVAQGLLMQQGVDGFVSALLPWSVFVLIHGIEWLRNPQRGSLLSSNFGLSLLIATFGLIALYLFPNDYMWTVTLFHVVVNNRGNRNKAVSKEAEITEANEREFLAQEISSLADVQVELLLNLPNTYDSRTKSSRLRFVLKVMAVYPPPHPLYKKAIGRFFSTDAYSWLNKTDLEGLLWIRELWNNSWTEEKKNDFSNAYVDLMVHGNISTIAKTTSAQRLSDEDDFIAAFMPVIRRYFGGEKIIIHDGAASTGITTLNLRKKLTSRRNVTVLGTDAMTMAGFIRFEDGSIAFYTQAGDFIGAKINGRFVLKMVMEIGPRMRYSRPGKTPELLSLIDPQVDAETQRSRGFGFHQFNLIYGSPTENVPRAHFLRVFNLSQHLLGEGNEFMRQLPRLVRPGGFVLVGITDDRSHRPFSRLYRESDGEIILISEAAHTKDLARPLDLGKSSPSRKSLFYWIFIASLWETKIFQANAKTWTWILIIAFLFTAAHFIATWIRKSTGKDKAIVDNPWLRYSSLFLLSVFFSLPFMDIPIFGQLPGFIGPWFAQSPFWDAVAVHALYNALVLFTPLGKYLPVAGIGYENKSVHQLVAELKEAPSPGLQYEALREIQTTILSGRIDSMTSNDVGEILQKVHSPATYVRAVAAVAFKAVLKNKKTRKLIGAEHIDSIANSFGADTNVPLDARWFAFEGVWDSRNELIQLKHFRIIIQNLERLYRGDQLEAALKRIESILETEPLLFNGFSWRIQPSDMADLLVLASTHYKEPWLFIIEQIAQGSNAPPELLTGEIVARLVEMRAADRSPNAFYIDASFRAIFRSFSNPSKDLAIRHFFEIVDSLLILYQEALTRPLLYSDVGRRAILNYLENYIPRVAGNLDKRPNTPLKKEFDEFLKVLRAGSRSHGQRIQALGEINFYLWELRALFDSHRLALDPNSNLYRLHNRWNQGSQPPAGGVMEWVRRTFFHDTSRSRYALYAAWWIENIFSFAIANILVSSSLYLSTGHWQLDLPASCIVMWPIFYGLHGVDLIVYGRRSQPFGDFLAAGGIAAMSMIFVFFLPVSTAFAASFVVHFAVNALLFLRYEIGYQALIASFKKEARHSIHHVRLMEGVARYFGIEGDNDDRHRIATRIIGKIFYDKDLISRISKFFSKVSWHHTGETRFAPVMMAIVNQWRGRDVFDARAIEEIGDLDPNGYLHDQYLVHADPYHLGPQWVSSHKPSMRLPQPKEITRPVRWLDIGSAPGNHGAPTVTAIKAIFDRVLHQPVDIVGTDNAFPHASFDGRRFGTSPFATPAFLDEGEATINGITYVDAAKEKNDIAGDGFNLGEFDYISATFVLHHFNKPGDKIEARELMADVEWSNEVGQSIETPLYYMNQTQQAVFARLFGSLSEDNGIAFVHLPGAIFADAAWKRYHSEPNADLLVVVERLGPNQYRIYDGALPFSPKESSFSSVPFLLESHRDFKPGMRQVMRGQKQNFYKQAASWLEKADQLAFVYQRRDHSVWVRVRDALTTLHAGANLVDVFAVYLADVPDSEPIKEKILNGVRELSSTMKTRSSLPHLLLVPIAIHWLRDTVADFRVRRKNSLVLTDARKWGRLLTNLPSDREAATHAIIQFAAPKKILTRGDSPWGLEGLHAEIRRMVDGGEIRTPEGRRKLGAMVYAAKYVLTDNEYKGFVGDLNQIPMRGYPARVQITWVDDVAQAQTLIGKLSAQDRLIIGYDRERIAVGAFDAMADPRVKFVDGDDNTNVTELLTHVPESDRGKIAMNILVLSGVKLPPDFFNLSENDWELLRSRYAIYLVTDALVLEIPASHIPHLEAFRKALEAA